MMSSGSENLLDLDWDLPVSATPGKFDNEGTGTNHPTVNRDTGLLLDFSTESTKSDQGTGNFGSGNIDLLFGMLDTTPSGETTSKKPINVEDDVFLLDPLMTSRNIDVNVRKEPLGNIPSRAGGDNPEIVHPTRTGSPPEGSTRYSRTGSVDLDELLNLESNIKHQTMSQPGGKREKRNMEKSFEDLLAGLEDEGGELDLDELFDTRLLPQKITDDSFNAMAAQQSAVSYSASLKGKQEPTIQETNEFQEGLSENKADSVTEEYDIINLSDVQDKSEYTQEKEDEQEEEEPQEEEEEPQQEEEEQQQEEEESQEEETNTIDIMVTDDNDNNGNEDLDNNDENNRQTFSSDMEDDITEQQNNECEMRREASLDFSAVEGTPHLDVHIGKQKTSLRKRGSLARRKKPSRSNVRSMLLSAEDSHFQDSTEPKPSSTVNGYNDEDVFDAHEDDSSPTSPPAKKHSHLMVPLPGMGKPSPVARKMRMSKGEAENVKDGQLENKFDVPALRNVTKEQTNTPKTDDDMDLDKYFIKPALRSVPKPEQQSEELPSSPLEKRFDRPNLRSVQRDVESSPAKDLSESDKLFDIPVLKNVSRESDNTTRTTPSASDGTFGIPALRNVQQDSERPESLDTESGKTVAKLQLRNTPKPKMEPPESPQDKGKFDLPALRKTPRMDRSASVEQKLSGAFDVPALRIVSKPVMAQLECSDESTESSDNKHTFEKPALRNVSRSSSRIDSTTDKLDSSRKEEPNWFKDMKLRKTKPVLDDKVDTSEKEPEKASWIKAAAEKRGRAAEIINSKAENQNKSDNSNKPEWTEQSRLRKTPNGLPLQESSDNQENKLIRAPSVDEETKRYSRQSSADRESSVTSSSGSGRDKYEPSWLKTKDTRHKAPSNRHLTPSTSNTESSEMPQWKRELAERRKIRKDSEVPAAKPRDSLESVLPPWTTELSLKKIGTPTMRGIKPGTFKVASVEPEWKKQADEKRQRIMSLADKQSLDTNTDSCDSDLLANQRKLMINKDKTS